MSKNAISRRSGAFVLGRAAFSSISAVEGVRISKAMRADLRRLADAPASKRRAVMALKYGKR